MKKKWIVMCSALIISASLMAQYNETAPSNKSEQDKTEMEKKGIADRGNDLVFINEATSGGIMEVQLGQVAQQKASSQQVKDYGKMMAQHHSEANRKLTDLSKKLGVPVSSSVAEKHKKNIEDLQSKSGKEFDTYYIDMMVKDHKEDIAKFEKAQNEVTNNELKQWIATSLPTLKQHLSRAETLQDQLKKSN